MLDFLLVTGHVPGTNIDLTFYQIVYGLPLLLAVIYLLRRNRWLLRVARIYGNIYARQLQHYLRERLPA